MKIEMGESLVYSWLRHVKCCQVVQTNWKVSSQWKLYHEDMLRTLMETADTRFSEKYGYKIFKKNASLAQILSQGECDAIGISLHDGIPAIYATEVAFHPSVMNALTPCIEDVNHIFQAQGLNFQGAVIANSDFNRLILSPIIGLSNDVADTSELFLRSYQMYKMFNV